VWSADSVKILMGDPDVLDSYGCRHNQNLFVNIEDWNNQLSTDFPLSPPHDYLDKCVDFIVEVFAAFPFLKTTETAIFNIFSMPEYWERGIPFIQDSPAFAITHFWFTTAIKKHNDPLLRWIWENNRECVQHREVTALLLEVAKCEETDPDFFLSVRDLLEPMIAARD
jgi:hypothetical protein